MSHNDNLYVGCPVQYARQFISGKWQIGILWNLRNQGLRFNEIKKQLPDMPDKTLMQELIFFVEKKIIERNTYELPFQKTEYTLSAAGRSLIPVITAIVEWGYLHLQDERVTKEMGMTPLSAIDVIESNMR